MIGDFSATSAASPPAASRPVSESRSHVLQRRLSAILVRERNLGAIHWPLDTQRGIVPPQSPIAIRSIIIGDLVDDLRLGLKRTVAMRKAGRNPYLRPILGTEDRTYVLSECRGAHPDIDSHIEH